MTAKEVRIGFQNLKKRKKALTMLMVEINEERLQAENIHGLNFDKLNTSITVIIQAIKLFRTYNPYRENTRPNKGRVIKLTKNAPS